MFLVRTLSREKNTKHFSTLFKTLAPRRQVARETKVLRQNDLVFWMFSFRANDVFFPVEKAPEKTS